ncbi:hypothetical protein KSP40_PGU006632 [Platanthera guangdongensis]|uniref:Uncharacterized protein n=1 Tax=Platanthera guangdongensis TaxID=2320717 RepID=A0ABR2LT62_9ASPA
MTAADRPPSTPPKAAAAHDSRTPKSLYIFKEEEGFLLKIAEIAEVAVYPFMTGLKEL